MIFIYIAFNLYNMDLTSYIVNDIRPIQLSNTVEEALSFFEDDHINHIPVTENEKLIGMLSKESLENIHDHSLAVNNVSYMLNSFFCSESENWIDLIKIFSINETNIIPIVDQNNKYLGYFELDDILKGFSQVPFFKESGAIVVIEKETNQYALSEITQIIESNNGKILGLFVSKLDESTTTLTVKFNSDRVNETIQSFRRYDYIIVSAHEDDYYLSSLKERSEYLIKYLDV